MIHALVCIPSRLGIAAASHYGSSDVKKFLAVLGLMVSIGFLSLYAGIWHRDVGLETGGKKIWWKEYRIIHGLLWLGFSISMFKAKENAWMFLVLDVVISLILSFIKYNS